MKKEVEKLHNYILPGSGAANNIVENYGATPVVYNVPSSSTTEASQPTVHIADRVANMEAMVTAFVAEKSLFHWRRLLLTFPRSSRRTLLHSKGSTCSGLLRLIKWFMALPRHSVMI